MNEDFELLAKLEYEIDSMLMMIKQKLQTPINEKFWENN
jgi:predicted glycosyltransferase involved in capsule biosynthesis